jgi:polyhydroxyalkanoate synthesis regulator phasin
MISKSLPAVLQQALENHVNQYQLTHDDELQGIYERLTNLNEKVEFLKNKIKSNREKTRID